MTGARIYQEIRVVAGKALLVTGAEVLLIEGGPEVEMWVRA